MTIAKKIESTLSRSSWIRQMFEEGARLKKIHGEENVFDFSLGNPNVPPPEKFREVLADVASRSLAEGHGYMPNTGYPDARGAVAAFLNQEQGCDLTADDVVMTCGASGALNVIFKTLLDPGDEVVTPTPHFVEYFFYADNHNGVLKTVPTHPDFSLNLDLMDEMITAKTKIVLINSPNNPTGCIYSEESLKALGALIEKKSVAFQRTIYLVSDEPYRKIVFDGLTVPSVFAACPNSLVATSYSKDLSIPGERIGFTALNPACWHKKEVLGGMALANRILGFVNAPALMQKVVAALQGTFVDVGIYARKRELICDVLSDCGYEFTKPGGAFYLFPRAPVPDDVAFVRALQEERVLCVPGSGFGGPGHFRIAFCVSDATITGSKDGFAKALEKFK